MIPIQACNQSTLYQICAKNIIYIYHCTQCRFCHTGANYPPTERMQTDLDPVVPRYMYHTLHPILYVEWIN